MILRPSERARQPQLGDANELPDDSAWSRKPLEVYDLARSDGPAVFAPPRRSGAGAVVIAADLLALAGPVLLAAGGRIPAFGFAVLAVLLLQQGGLYRPRLHLSVLDDAPRILGRVMAAALGVAVITYAFHYSVEATFALSTAVAIILDILLRASAYKFIGFVRRRGGATHRTCIIGGGLVAAELANTLVGRPVYGLNVVGFLDSDPLMVETAGPTPYLGELSDLGRVLVELRIEVLIVAFGNLPESAMIDVLRATDVAGCDIFVVPRLYEVYGRSQGSSDHIGGIAVQRIRRSPRLGPSWRVKRLLDVSAAALGLIALLPFLAVVAVAVRLEGGNGVLFRQTRVGRDGREFELLKFRSMRPASRTESDTNWNISQDHRIGRVGRFIRRTSLDELPQLLNILRGDMSLVGPRPERPFFVDQFSIEHPHYFHRHRVPCGLTGLAQVSGLRGDTSIADRTRYDNYYIENWSLWLDVKILLTTAREVLGATGG